ncbi:DUF4340 domain-containing protein [Oleomonas cavernae]|uniref:DUF4340 domain-containing protein n=1 Tax=Oleomonas cavernae TaxID=2320859 RepID=A0A418WT83_9PROT|nr:DUF4340 domain-containing protein [Oleomonas cavernae]RJF94460.1 DUF4340 domain-containing protein [Oleomonas cavernae]
MRRSTLAILLGLTILLSLAGAWLVIERIRETQADLSGQLMLPDLKAALNDVAEVSFTGAEGAFSLKRVEGETWVMPQRGGYRVDFAKVQRLLLALADLKAIEPKTARPDRYRFLDVEDVAQGTKGLRLTVKDGQGEALADLILGRPDETMGAAKVSRFFLRFAGEAQSWLGEAELRVERDPAQWLDRELTVIAPVRIRAVSVTHADATVRIAREKPDAPFLVADLAAGTEDMKTQRANALSVAATYLVFEDVKTAPAATDPEKPAIKVVYETFDGVVVTFEIATVDGQGWATIAAVFEDSIAAEGAKIQAPPGPDGAAIFKMPEAAKAEAAALAAKTKGWAYRIDGTRVIDLTPARADLVQPKTLAPPGVTPALPPLPGLSVPPEGRPVPMPQ